LTPVRVLLDVNVVVSFLLALPRPESTVARVILLGLRGELTMIVSERMLDEVRASFRRPYLSARMSYPAVEAVLGRIAELGIEAPRVEPPIPRVCRDPRDDYLIAQAIASGATHLLTGHRDLLALKDAGLPFAIVTPAELAAEPGIGED